MDSSNSGKTRKSPTVIALIAGLVQVADSGRWIRASRRLCSWKTRMSAIAIAVFVDYGRATSAITVGDSHESCDYGRRLARIPRLRSATRATEGQSRHSPATGPKITCMHVNLENWPTNGANARDCLRLGSSRATSAIAATAVARKKTIRKTMKPCTLQKEEARLQSATRATNTTKVARLPRLPRSASIAEVAARSPSVTKVLALCYFYIVNRKVTCTSTHYDGRSSAGWGQDSNSRSLNERCIDVVLRPRETLS